jgi:sigma-B regulation protein RsbU (phosphoserine phosphatase)
MVNGLMSSLAPRRRRPADLMKALNDALVLRKVEGRYVTLLLVLWHPESASFTMANAGGSPPMICRGGDILKFEIEGVPLGLLPGQDYEEMRIEAQPGDLVVLFSDGVSDHLDGNGQDYGREGLERVLRGCCDCSTQDIVQAIFDDLDRFNTVRFDDQTLMVMRVKQPLGESIVPL